MTNIQNVKQFEQALEPPRFGFALVSSIEERYQTHNEYVRKVTRAAIHLYRQRLLLDQDVKRYIEEAETSNIGK